MSQILKADPIVRMKIDRSGKQVIIIRHSKYLSTNITSQSFNLLDFTSLNPYAGVWHHFIAGSCE
jgi:hypothetical protein